VILLSLIRAGHAAVRDHARLLSRDGSSSRELVGPDITAAATLERYPRFIKDQRRFPGLRASRGQKIHCQSKHVPSLRSRLPGTTSLESPPTKSRISAVNTLRATPSICTNLDFGSDRRGDGFEGSCTSLARRSGGRLRHIGSGPNQRTSSISICSAI
jgi:hypothetical protein